MTERVYATNNARALVEDAFVQFAILTFHEEIVAPTIAAEESAATRALGFVPCPADHGFEDILDGFDCHVCGAWL